MAQVNISRIERALLITARVVAHNAAALPIFERLDTELQAARAELAARHTDDPLARARALAQLRRAG
ncbi:hypothetical protein SAMN04489859_102059 [Paracoccus alcaliphilus]|uniref:Uncharacterized protein n=1 Tax=Paracoccus alcaliphilus TaxID=34002 RepID=A0A1H8K4N3_9RHOB|nr:hypothetical protein [Paracoccus alcaliphilus]WCR17554.1 hypothetical protein JHW40_14635 [Paracoccus alcaliphilus]SEN87960.1 hypothetical protein SAMN04489859_102059 [Paracoccus alcaliphilus]